MPDIPAFRVEPRHPEIALIEIFPNEVQALANFAWMHYLGILPSQNCASTPPQGSCYPPTPRFFHRPDPGGLPLQLRLFVLKVIKPSEVQAFAIASSSTSSLKAGPLLFRRSLRSSEPYMSRSMSSLLWPSIDLTPSSSTEGLALLT